MYWLISEEFIPISSTGRDSVTKCISILTAFVTISSIYSFDILLFKCLYRRQAKSVCIPSSLLINSFENVSPGIRPLFFNQNIAQKLPEKKIPSTHAECFFALGYLKRGHESEKFVTEQGIELTRIL